MCWCPPLWLSEGSQREAMQRLGWKLRTRHHLIREGWGRLWDGSDFQKNDTSSQDQGAGRLEITITVLLGMTLYLDDVHHAGRNVLHTDGRRLAILVPDFTEVITEAIWKKQKSGSLSLWNIHTCRREQWRRRGMKNVSSPRAEIWLILCHTHRVHDMYLINICWMKVVWKTFQKRGC